MNIAEGILRINNFSIIKEDYSAISEREEKLIISQIFDFLREKGYYAKYCSHSVKNK